MAASGAGAPFLQTAVWSVLAVFPHLCFSFPLMGKTEPFSVAAKPLGGRCGYCLFGVVARCLGLVSRRLVGEEALPFLCAELAPFSSLSQRGAYSIVVLKMAQCTVWSVGFSFRCETEGSHTPISNGGFCADGAKCDVRKITMLSVPE